MKKKLNLLIALCVLIGATLMACAESPANEDTYQSAAISTEAEPATPETIPQDEELAPVEADAPVEGQEAMTTYTIEQIQAALQPQFQVGNWGEGNPQVISVQRVEREVDYLFLESGGSYVDLSAAVRYRVAVRFRQSIEDYNMWAGSENNPFSRDGDYTILTDYYHFQDVNGNPELAFIGC